MEAQVPGTVPAPLSAEFDGAGSRRCPRDATLAPHIHRPDAGEPAGLAIALGPCVRRPRSWLRRKSDGNGRLIASQKLPSCRGSLDLARRCATQTKSTLAAAGVTIGLHEHGNGRRDDLVDFLARRWLGHCAKKPGSKNARLRKL